jgi:hypothetical protein
MIVQALTVAAVAATASMAVAAPAPVRVAAVADKAASAAARTVLYGQPSAWVRPAETPPAPTAEPGAAFVYRLIDQQVSVSADGEETYTDIVFKILTEEGLAAGSLTQEWDPASRR